MGCAYWNPNGPIGTQAFSTTLQRISRPQNGLSSSNGDSHVAIVLSPGWFSRVMNPRQPKVGQGQVKVAIVGRYSLVRGLPRVESPDAAYPSVLWDRTRPSRRGDVCAGKTP